MRVSKMVLVMFVVGVCMQQVAGRPSADEMASRQQNADTVLTRIPRKKRQIRHETKRHVIGGQPLEGQPYKGQRTRMKKRDSNCQRDITSKEHVIIQQLAEVASRVEMELAEVAKYEKASLVAQRKFKEDIDKIQAIETERKIFQLQSAESAQRADCVQNQLRREDKMLCQLRDRLDELYTQKVAQENAINNREKRGLTGEEAEKEAVADLGDQKKLIKRSSSLNDLPPFQFHDTAPSISSSQIESLLQGLARSLEKERAAIANKQNDATAAANKRSDADAANKRSDADAANKRSDVDAANKIHNKHASQGGRTVERHPFTAEDIDTIRRPAVRQSCQTCGDNYPKPPPSSCQTCGNNYPKPPPSSCQTCGNNNRLPQSDPYSQMGPANENGFNAMPDGMMGQSGTSAHASSGGKGKSCGASCDAGDKHPCKTAEQEACEEKEKQDYNKLIEMIYLEEARLLKGQEDRAKINEAVIAENKRLDAITQRMTLIKEEMKHTQQDAVVAWQRVKCAQEKLAYHDERLYEARTQLDALNVELTAVRAGTICARAKRDGKIKRRYRKSLEELKDELWGNASLADDFKEHLDSLAEEQAPQSEDEADAESTDNRIKRSIHHPVQSHSR